MPLVEPPPTQIAIQIPSGHSIESLHPSLQPAVVGIDVLDMENPFLHPDASLDIHGLMGNSGILCHSLEGFAPVGAQESILPKHRLKGAPEMLRINSIKNRIKGLTIAIPGNQNGNLLNGKPWFCRFSSPFPSWPRQFPLTFEGLQEKSLVCLRYAGQPSGRVAQPFRI